MPTTLTIWNKRAVMLMKKAVKEEIVHTEKEFCDKIGFDKTNITKVKSGALGFQIKDLIKISKFMGVSMDYICGLTNERK